MPSDDESDRTRPETLRTDTGQIPRVRVRFGARMERAWTASMSGGGGGMDDEEGEGGEGEEDEDDEEEEDEAASVSSARLY